MLVPLVAWQKGPRKKNCEEKENADSLRTDSVEGIVYIDEKSTLKFYFLLLLFRVKQLSFHNT